MAKRAAYGTTISLAGVAIGNVKSIKGPGVSRDFIDVSDMDSTNFYREFAASWKTGGEVTVTAHLVPGVASQKAAFDSLDGTGNAVVAVSLQYPAAPGGSAPPAWTFNAFVSKFEPTANHDGALEVEIGLKQSGDIGTMMTAAT